MVSLQLKYGLNHVYPYVFGDKRVESESIMGPYNQHYINSDVNRATLVCLFVGGARSARPHPDLYSTPQP